MAAAWAKVAPPLFPRCPRLTLRLRSVPGTLFPAADVLGTAFPTDPRFVDARAGNPAGTEFGEVAAEYLCRILLLNTAEES